MVSSANLKKKHARVSFRRLSKFKSVCNIFVCGNTTYIYDCSNKFTRCFHKRKYYMFYRHTNLWWTYDECTFFSNCMRKYTTILIKNILLYLLKIYMKKLCSHMETIYVLVFVLFLLGIAVSYWLTLLLFQSYFKPIRKPK